jgi:acyl-CoA hydrolase
MFSDAVVSLVEAGVITNSRKTLAPGKMAVSFAMGSQKLYDFLDGNELVEFFGSDWINNPANISQNLKMTAINSALQIDLTGQICADSLGTEMYSGCGGQVDFVRGASHAPGGKAIIALESTARGGSISRIVPTLATGAGVVTSRADLHYVVTEYGIANLHGKNMKDRVKALIEIAHPAFRDELERGARQYKWLGQSFSMAKS